MRKLTFFDIAFPLSALAFLVAALGALGATLATTIRSFFHDPSQAELAAQTAYSLVGDGPLYWWVASLVLVAPALIGLVLLYAAVRVLRDAVGDLRLREDERIRELVSQELESRGLSQ